MTKSFGMFLLLGLVAGCSFHARSPNEYRDATQALLDTKSAEIKTCYDDALKGKSDLAGTVTVKFTVEAETGALSNVSADAAKTQAPEVLTQCVVKSLEGLKLDPPDANPGDATFEYQFVVGPRPPPPRAESHTEALRQGRLGVNPDGLFSFVRLPSLSPCPCPCPCPCPLSSLSSQRSEHSA